MAQRTAASDCPLEAVKMFAFDLKRRCNKVEMNHGRFEPYSIRSESIPFGRSKVVSIAGQALYRKPWAKVAASVLHERRLRQAPVKLRIGVQRIFGRI